MSEGVRPSFRKHRRESVLSFYGVVTRDGRPMWSCEHDHTAIRLARACARRWIRLGAGAVPTPVNRGGTRQRTASLPVLGNKPVLRRSSMERLIACAVSEPDQSENAAFGNYVHDCIHEYLLECIASGRESRWTALEQIAVNQFYRVPRGLPPHRLDEAKDLLDRFAHTHLADLDTLMYLPGEEGGALRPALEYTLRADVGWAVVEGTVDRLDRLDGDDRDDPPRIVQATDYKTQWAASPHLFQGRTYAKLAFMQPWASQLEEFRWMPDPFKLRRSPTEGAISYYRGDLDEWWESTLVGVKQRWELRLSGRARPTGGSACQYCALRYSCPAALPMARGIPENIDQAVELVGEWVRMEQSTKLRRESLTAFFKDRAPLQYNGFEVGFMVPHETEKQFKVSDPMGVVNALTALGLDGAALMTTWVPPDKVPVEYRPGLVLAGVARYERGKPTFKKRKAGAAGDEEDDA